MFGHSARVRRSSSRNHRATRNRLLRNEALEPRTLLSGSGLSSSIFPSALVGAQTPANAGPTIVQPITINGNAAVTGKTASLSVLGTDAGGQASLKYTWSVTAAPTGGTVAFSSNGTNAAQSSMATFSMAGTYSLTVKIVDAGGLSVSSVKSVVVSQVWTSTKYPVVATVYVTGTTLQPVVPAFLDQFGNPMTNPPALTWSTVNLPSGRRFLFSRPAAPSPRSPLGKRATTCCRPKARPPPRSHLSLW